MLPYACWLLLLPFALAQGLQHDAPATLLLREEFLSAVSELQIQGMVMFLSSTKSTGFFKKVPHF